jgi:hypothetical protein
MGAGAMARVFISHASKDREIIDREIRPLLESHGLSTWCSEYDIRGADQFERIIMKALVECEWFLVAMSPNSAKSRWVGMEVHWAMEERHDHFVPVMLGPIDYNDWHLGIRQLRIIDFTGAGENAKRDLLAAFGIVFDASHTRGEGSTQARPEPSQTGNIARALSKNIALTGFDYFCYISQSKVEQLFDQIPPDELTRTADEKDINSRVAGLRQRVAEARDGDSCAVPDLEQEIAWLETVRRLTGLRFGKKPAVGPHATGAVAEDSSSSVMKARTVLRYILLHKSVRDLESAVCEGSNLDAFCYAYEGPHRFEDFARPGMAIISSRVGDRTLRQYCSLKYFSDMDLKETQNGELEAHPHSLNFPFFQKDSGISYGMISFLFVTGVRDMTIFGSPICMILDSRKGIPL